MQFLKTPTPRPRSPTSSPYTHTTTTTLPLFLSLAPSHLCSFTILYYSLDVNFQQVFNDDDDDKTTTTTNCLFSCWIEKSGQEFVYKCECVCALAKSTRISVKSENTTSQEPQAKPNAPQSIQQTTIHEILLRIIFQPNSIPVSNGNSATPTSTSTFISASTRAIYHWSSGEWFFFYSDFILVFFVLGCGQSCRSHSVPVTFYASDIHTHTHTQQHSMTS